MTEKKQYELKLCSNGLYYLWVDGDLFIGDDGYIEFAPFDKSIGQWFVDELNKLSNQNDKLKKENIGLKTLKVGIICDNCSEMLKKENGQLKEELKDYSDANAQLEQQNKLLKNTLNQEQEIMKELKTKIKQDQI